MCSSLLCCCLTLLGACQRTEVPDNQFPGTAFIGDTSDGEALVREFGCDGCHRIPGVRSATGRVGPALDRMARRAYVGGILPNTHEALVRWLLDPRAVDPDSAMPDTGLSLAQAEALAAFLHTLD